MNRRGDYAATPADAPTIDFDEEFWRELETGDFVPVANVELVIAPATLDFFREHGPNAVADMSRVLDAYAKARTKKAS